MVGYTLYLTKVAKVCCSYAQITMNTFLPLNETVYSLRSFPVFHTQLASRAECHEPSLPFGVLAWLRGEKPGHISHVDLQAQSCPGGGLQQGAVINRADLVLEDSHSGHLVQRLLFYFEAMFQWSGCRWIVYHLMLHSWLVLEPKKAPVMWSAGRNSSSWNIQLHLLQRRCRLERWYLITGA